MNWRKKVKRIIAVVLPAFDDKNIEYWEKAARINPYAAICTGHSEQDFEENVSSIIFDPHVNVQLTPFPMRVLDLCCGLGRIAPRLAPQVSQYIGVDFSGSMIIQARQRHHKLSNVFFLINDGKTVPLPDNSMDIVFCELAFQHMTKDVIHSYVEDVYRILSSGGLFLAQVPQLTYYQDNRFGFTLHETKNLFHRYEATYLPYGEAYFLVRAMKVDD